MLIRSFGTLVALIWSVSYLQAVEPPAPSPEPSKLIETKLPIKASYPVKIHPAKTEQTEKATIHLPESVVRELAAKLNEKRSSAAPLGDTRGDNSFPSSLPHGATIVAGCVISLAMIGFVLLRQRRSRWAWLGGASGVVLVGLVIANYSQANAPPPPEFYLKREEAKNKCLIVIVPDGGEIELFVPEK